MAAEVNIKQGQKRKRVVLTLKQKMDICQRLERGENRNIIMKEFNIGSSTLYDIKARSGKLKEFLIKSESGKNVENRYTLHTPRLEHLDRALYEWFILKKSEGADISGPLLVEKAKEIYKKMNLTEPCAFSDGWLTRFKIRHGIRNFNVSCEQKNADQKTAEESADDFCEYFSNLVMEYGLTADQVYYADEMVLLWQCLPKSILAAFKKTSVYNKERLTVLVCANAAGTHKVKLTVVGRNVKPRYSKSLTHLPVHYVTQRNTWLTAETFVWWFHHVFVPSVKDNLRKTGLPEDSQIVLLDNCRSHPPAHELVNDNIFVCFLPTNVTSLIQPMNQGVIQNLKLFYKRNYLRKLVNNEDNIHEFQSLFNIKDAVSILSCAWNSVKSVTLQRCWRKLYPQLMFGKESDDSFEAFNIRKNKQANNTYEEIIELVNHVSAANTLGKLSKQQLDEWLEIEKDASVSMTLTTDERETVFNHDKPAVLKENSGKEEVKAVTWNNAAAAFDTLITFVEQQSCFCPQDIMQLHLIHSTFLNERRNYSDH